MLLLVPVYHVSNFVYAYVFVCVCIMPMCLSHAYVFVCVSLMLVHVHSTLAHQTFTQDPMQRAPLALAGVIWA